MKKLRAATVAIVAAALVVLLLDWTLGALDALYIGRLADVRRLRESCEVLPGGALALSASATLHLGNGSFTIRTDADGFRVPAGNPASSRALGSHIVVVGDGATLGWGVEDALTFARRLEPRLADAGRRAVVRNAGQLFLEPGDLPALLEERVVPAEVHIVVVCGPTSNGALPAEWRAIAAGEASRTPWWGRALPSIWAVSRRLADGPPRPEQVPLDRDAWRDSLEAVRALCDGLGVACLAVDLGADGFAAACAEAGVTCLPADLGGAGIATWTSDATRRFPTPAGHARIADQLGPALAMRLPARTH